MVMSLGEIHSYLESVSQRPQDPPLEAIKDALTALKGAALAHIGEGEANARALWCLEETLEAQNRYLLAFASIRAHNFYEGWCDLERAELALSFLEPHEIEPSSRFRLDFIRRYVPKWQALFPYRVFLSPEILEHEKECSICGRVVSPRNPCGHRVGEIYGGQMCLRIVTKAEPMGIGFVEKPVQKYSVPFLHDSATKKTRDHYNYEVVRYAADRLIRPFDEWDVVRTTRMWPHSRFREVGRNDPCPCDSDKKYKKCCLQKEGVVRPHLEFRFAIPPPADQMRDIYIP